MKVLITTDPGSGVWEYTGELVRQYDRLGHDVAVASSGGAIDAGQRAELADLSRVALHEAEPGVAWSDDPDECARADEWLGRLLEGLNCDLLHLNDYAPAGRDWGIPSLLVAHTCELARQRATHRGEPGSEWQPYRERVAAAFRHASLVAAPTRAFLEELREIHPGAAAARATVIYNGTDPARWPPGAERERLFVLGVGCLADESKNLGALAAAAEGLPYPVLIAGARSTARAGGKAILLNRLPRTRLAAYYRRALVFVHPARHEPFGLPVLEAALSGCALVLGDIPSLRELWGPVATFVDPNDARALRESIADLAARPEEHAEAGRRARQHALRYTAHTMALHYLGCYRSLLARPTARAAGQ